MINTATKESSTSRIPMHRNCSYLFHICIQLSIKSKSDILGSSILGTRPSRKCQNLRNSMIFSMTMATLCKVLHIFTWHVLVPEQSTQELWRQWIGSEHFCSIHTQDLLDQQFFAWVDHYGYTPLTNKEVNITLKWNACQDKLLIESFHVKRSNLVEVCVGTNPDLPTLVIFYLFQ